MSDWGQGAKNNNIGWGQGAVNNDISWGKSHELSYSGDTEIFGTSLDPSYQAILDYANTQGYTLPSEGQRALQNQLVVDLKEASIWDKLDTFANFATDGSSDFALIDWIRLTDFTAVNSPAFTINEGFQGDGVSSYIDTNYNPSLDASNYTQNSAGISAYQFALSSASRYIIGTATTDSGEARIRTTTSDAEYQINGVNISNVSGINSNVIGNLHMDRISSTEMVMQANETLGNIVTDISTGVPQNNFWLLRITSIESDSGVSNFCARSGFTKAEKDIYNGIYNTYINAL